MSPTFIRFIILAFCVSVVSFLFFIYSDSQTQQSRRTQFSEPIDIKPFSAPKDTQTPSMAVVCVGQCKCNMPKRTVQEVDCQKLFEGDKKEVQHGRELIKLQHLLPSDDDYRIPNDCSVLKSWGYQQDVLLQEERNFPIAISILMHNNVYQFENLLRLIYKPQNSYCVHVDKKANQSIFDSVKGIAKCFPNVHIASNLVEVGYADFSKLQADINCMDELLQKDKQWKYLINIASSALPLKTNLEMVKILKLYNGANDVEGHAGRWLNKVRKRKHPPLRTKAPHGIKVLKGSAYNTYSRAFVEWVRTDKKPLDLLDYMEDLEMYSPDEHYWATLHHLKYNPQLKTPGGYSGRLHRKPWLASFSAWPHESPCYGTWSKHGMCQFGIADLPYLSNVKAFFANKFNPHIDELAGRCLGELIRNRTVIAGPMQDWYYYSTLGFLHK